MPFTTPDFASIRDALLRDLASQLPTAPLGADSDWRIRANAVAAAIEGLYFHQAWLARQIFPDTADSDALMRHASLHGLYRKAATQADGTVTVRGAVGVLVPEDTEFTNPLTEQTYLSTADVTLADETAVVPVQAVTAGIAANAVAGTVLTITDPPNDLAAAATVIAITGGTDTESDTQLLDRLLLYLQTPPAGGSQADYRHWAYAVSGVTAAWCYPLRRGPGTVDVAVWSAGAPSAATLAAVTTYIDTLRPVTADVLVMAPQALTVAITATLTLASAGRLDAIRDSAAEDLAALFAELSPGDTLYINLVEAVLRDQPGVTDVNLISPATNVISTVDAAHLQLPILGTVDLI
jgi:uncharacterized phage protein gp47/JayE